MAIELIKSAAQSEFAREVCTGLTKSRQKELPSKYLYDAVGSALFEVISVLPEYGVTRAEERILGRHAAEIVSDTSHAGDCGGTGQWHRKKDPYDP